MPPHPQPRATLHNDYQLAPSPLHPPPPPEPPRSAPKFSRRPSSPFDRHQPPSPKISPSQPRFLPHRQAGSTQSLLLEQSTLPTPSGAHSVIEKPGSGEGSKMQLMKKTVKKLTKSNDRLATRLKEQGRVGEFLMEREAFIGELQQRNAELAALNARLESQLEQARARAEEESHLREEAERETDKWRAWYELLEEQQALAIEEIVQLREQVSPRVPQLQLTLLSDRQQGKRRGGDKENEGEWGSEQARRQLSQLSDELRSKRIEVDVLRKVRAEAQRVATHNQRLHGDNARLLRRVDYLTRTMEGARGHPDSSLELSLSPATSRTDIK